MLRNKPAPGAALQKHRYNSLCAQNAQNSVTPVQASHCGPTPPAHQSSLILKLINHDLITLCRSFNKHSPSPSHRSRARTHTSLLLVTAHLRKAPQIFKQTYELWDMQSELHSLRLLQRHVAEQLQPRQKGEQQEPPPTPAPTPPLLKTIFNICSTCMLLSTVLVNSAVLLKSLLIHIPQRVRRPNYISIKCQPIISLHGKKTLLTPLLTSDRNNALSCINSLT